MPYLNDTEFLVKYKNILESKLSWKEPGLWRNRDVEYLSEEIYKKTKTNISTSTLKRILNPTGNRNPHLSTLNALAQFIDFEDWNCFKGQMAHNYSKQKVEKKLRRKPRINMRVTFLIVLLLIGGISIGVIVLKPNHKVKIPIGEIEKEKVLFTSKTSVTSGLPNSVVFNYDIKYYAFDSAFIQQSWDRRRRKPIFADKNYHTSIYYYPGYYTARLVLNNKVIKRHPLFIQTDGWQAVYQENFNQEIPSYFNNLNLHKPGRLHLSVDDLKQNKIERNSDFFIGLMNFRDFNGVRCDSLTFETIVKNDVSDGGLTCQYAMVALEAERGVLRATFSDPGCISKLSVEFSNIRQNGSDNDLSAFGIDLNQWNKITYNIADKHTTILVNDNKIHELTFKRDIGKIVGIYYYFYGCGSVKMAKLLDKNGVAVFEDGF